jgi:hypothetical protein
VGENRVEEKSKKTTLEFTQRGEQVVIVKRRPGQQPVRIIADTVPPPQNGETKKEDAA